MQCCVLQFWRGRRRNHSHGQRHHVFLLGSDRPAGTLRPRDACEALRDHRDRINTHTKLLLSHFGQLLSLWADLRLHIPSSSSSMQVKGKRSEFGPSCALWFLLLTSWESSASLQKCPWLIKVGRVEEPCTYFGPCCGLLFRFGGVLALFSFILSSDGSVTEPDMSACFCPDHKAPMVLFLERVYGIQDQNFLMHMLEVGFLPDLRASASLDTVGTKQSLHTSQQRSVPKTLYSPPTVTACLINTMQMV